MAQDNLFADFEKTLIDFKKFIDENKGGIQTVISNVAKIIPRILDLLRELIDLLEAIETEIKSFDLSTITDPAQLNTFIEGVGTILETAKTLLPDEEENIDRVMAIAKLAASLESLDEIRDHIVELLEDIREILAAILAESE